MLDLWLTRDQQGQVLFKFGHFQQAATTFTNLKWQAYSFYAAENFAQAASIYGQLDNLESKLSQANAMAHGRHYVKAKGIYQTILSATPNHEGAQKNLNIVQAIVNEINLSSKNQVAEQGESSKALRDEPQTADRAERQNMSSQKVTQLTAEQLLQDPQLTEIWLRQVQKNPARFLSYKLQLQARQQTALGKLDKDDDE